MGREATPAGSARGPSVPLRTGPSAPLRTGPSAPLRTGPSAPLRTGPSAPLRTGPSAPLRTGFDGRLAGHYAECDGGGAIAGTRLAGREEFAGTLTGDYVDHGDPPWRWYLLRGLTRRPQNYPWDEVWCESGSLFVGERPGECGS